MRENTCYESRSVLLVNRSKLKCNMIKSRFNETRWTLVCIPIAGFILVALVAFWSIISLLAQEITVINGPDDYEYASADCDICLMVHMGDSGDHPPSEKNLPFTVLHRLFEKVKDLQKSSVRERPVCVGVDHPSIVCRMVRDAIGSDANCWNIATMPKRRSPVSCKDMVVGDTNQYLPQVPIAETQTKFTWQRFHIVDLDTKTSESRPPALESIRPTIVTGFSANHLSVGMLLLRSIGKAATGAKKQNPKFDICVVVWTMDEFMGKDKDDFECVLKEMNETWKVEVEVRKFSFLAYPAWMRIQQAHEGFNEFGTGEYAWKVIMIHTILVERGFVLWQDAGDRFKTTKALTATLDYIAEHGFASRISAGNIMNWTHWKQIRYLRATMLDMGLRNCDASAVGLTLKKYEEVARPWYECAMTRQCIAPDGSSRLNHRQDQAALTLLTYLSNSSCEGIDLDDGLQMDYNLADTAGTDPTSCYKDPRQ